MVSEKVSHPLFVDSSAFVSLYDEKDSLNSRAWELLKKIPDEWSIYTSSEVISETLTVISQKLGKHKCAYFYDQVLYGIEMIMIDINIFNEAIDLFKKIKSKNVSFVDCTSFVICKQHKIKTVFTFDQHFKKQELNLLAL